MAYDIFLDGIRLPAAPDRLRLKIKNRNGTAELISGAELSILKSAGLSEISFDAVLPQTRRPYASYPDGFKGADYYLGLLKRLKTSMKPFGFIVSRSLPDGTLLFETNMRVSLEEYEIIEDAAEGFDVIVSINLRQYVEHTTKTIDINEGGAVVTETRAADSAPAVKSHTVQTGDCLWNIAKKYLGNGERYTEIYELNKDKIKNPNLIYAGQMLVLP